MNTGTKLRLGSRYEYDASEFLGKGQYGVVYGGRDLETKQKIAVKSVDLSRRNPTELKYLNQETQVMKKVNHPNVIRLLYDERSPDQQTLYLALEYCGGGDLKGLLERQQSRCLDEDTARDFMIQLASGLRHLHDLGIVHRDLKPHNLLLTSKSKDADLKIADLGFARSYDNQQMLVSYVGTPLYMAPEVFLGAPYSSNSDLWSVGVIFYEMLTGTTPLAPRDHKDLYDKLSSNSPGMPRPPKASPHCLDLLNGLLQKDRSKRLDWDSFFQHPYLQPKSLAVAAGAPEETAPKSPEKPKQSDSKPASPQLPTPVKLKPAEQPAETALISRFSWLQHFYVFNFHGHDLTLYLRPSTLVKDIKFALSGMMSLSPNDLILVAGDGTVMMDNLIVDSYNLPANSLLVHVYPTSVFRGEKIQVPDYDFDNMPESDQQVLEVEKNIYNSKLIDEALEVLKAREKKVAKATQIHEAMRWKLGQIVKTVQANSYQEESLKVINGALLIKESFKLKSDLASLQQLFAEVSTEAKELIDAKDRVLAQLRSTTFDCRLTSADLRSQPSIVTLEGYISFLNKTNIVKDFEELKTSYESTTKAIAEGQKSYQKLTQVIDTSASKYKLDLVPVNGMIEARGHVGGYLGSVVARLDKMKAKFEQLSKSVNTSISTLSGDLAQNANATSSEGALRAAIKLPLFAEIDTLFNEVLKFDASTTPLFDKVRSYKTQACRQNVDSLAQRALILPELPGMFQPIHNALPLVDTIRLLLPKCRAASSLPKTYTELLEEVSRRNRYKRSVAKLAQTVNKRLETLREDELKEREIRRHDLEKPGAALSLAPFLFTPASAKLDAIALSIPVFDADLPEMAAEDKKHDLKADDDFELIDSDDPKDLQSKVHELEAGKADANKKIAELQARLAAAPAPAEKKAEAVPLFQQLKEKSEYHEKQVTNLSELLTERQKDITSLQSELRTKTQKMEDREQEFENLRKNYEALKAKYEKESKEPRFFIRDLERQEDEPILVAGERIGFPRDKLQQIITQMRQENKNPTAEVVMSLYVEKYLS